jgi:hypothetical protein
MTQRLQPARALAGLACLLGLATSATSAVGEGTAYDFAYRIAGDRQARPVQVFDDGSRTYFQFPGGAVIPLMLAGPRGERAVPRLEGPYHVVEGVPRRFSLVVAGHRATVQAAGDSAAHQVPAPTPTTSGDATVVPDVAPAGSYAVPLRGDALVGALPVRGGEQVLLFAAGSARLAPAAVDALRGLVRNTGSDLHVEVRASGGRLGVRRSSEVVRALVRHGVAPSRVALRVADGRAHEQGHAVSVRWRALGDVVAFTPASGGRPLPNQFDLLHSDRTVAQALQRWAARDGYRVVWQAGVHAPVLTENTLDARTVPEAAQRVVSGLRSAGYPLRLDMGEDQVIRIVQVHGP